MRAGRDVRKEALLKHYTRAARDQAHEAPLLLPAEALSATTGNTKTAVGERERDLRWRGAWRWVTPAGHLPMGCQHRGEHWGGRKLLFRHPEQMSEVQTRVFEV